MLILLHYESGHSFVVNTNIIQRMRVTGSGENEMFLSTGGSMMIKESPEEVVRLQERAFEQANRKG